MYRLAKTRSARQVATEQLPSLVGALLASELFFRFHSFTLECLAFLATWFILDGALALLTSRPSAKAEAIAPFPELDSNQ